MSKEKGNRPNEGTIGVGDGTISVSEAADKFRQGVTQNILTQELSKNPEKKKSLEVGGSAVVLEGDYAGKVLTIIKKEGAIATLQPGPGKPTFEMDEAQVFHLDDFMNAYHVALLAQQGVDVDNPQ